MIGRHFSWFAVAGLTVAALVIGVLGCELIASVDRTLIPTGGGGSGATGGTGGGGTGGTPYAMADGTQADAYTAITDEFIANGAEPVTAAVDVEWNEVVARPLPFDLSVEVSGVEGPLAQVFTLDEGPFARVGTRVEAIAPTVEYRIEVTRTTTAAWAQLIRVADREVILAGPVVEIVPPSDDVVTIRTAKEQPRVSVNDLRVTRGVPRTRSHSH